MEWDKPGDPTWDIPGSQRWGITAKWDESEQTKSAHEDLSGLF